MAKRGMTRSEKRVFDIISRNGNWCFVEMLDDDGNSKQQSKQYDPPCWVAYPDFEKRDGEKIISLVETKGYFGFFDNRADTVAMKYKSFRQYFVAQKKENAEVKVVFEVELNKQYFYYWETLFNMQGMEYYLDEYDGEKWIFWNIEDFKTDTDELGQ